MIPNKLFFNCKLALYVKILTLAFLLFIVAACSKTINDPENKPIAAVLTTDVGADIDDQWVLAHIMISPEIDLRAIVTTHTSFHGLSSAESAGNANEVLAQLSTNTETTLPHVLAGANQPLSDAESYRDNDGVRLLLEISQDFSSSQRLTVFVIGAATDVASAILIDSTIVNRITIVAMAFTEWPNGGDVFNVVNDPAAYQVILNSEVPLVVGSLNVCKEGLALLRSEAEELISGRGSLGDYLYSIFADYLDEHSSFVASFVSPDTWVIWDEIVFAYALGMVESEEVPRPKLNANLTFSHEETDLRMTWIKSIKTDTVWSDLTKKLDEHGL